MQLSLRIKYFITTIVFIVAITPLSVSAIESRAKYVLLLDYNTGTVLFEKNADEAMGPSSMTKLMTVYVMFEALKDGSLKLNDTMHVSETAWRKGGSKMFVKEGDDVKISDLLQGIIVQSGNDACIVVAEGMSGSEEAFAEDMNFVAKRLGLTGSHFKNSTGWPDKEHIMTARDLVKLAGHIIEDFPEYYPYFSQTEFTYNKIKQANRNKLLYKNIGVDGFKTGYTAESGYGIVASAVQDGRRLILAINGLKTSKGRIAEAERLLRHGFRDFDYVPLFKAGDEIDKAKIWLGAEVEVPLVIKENLEVIRNRRISKKSDIELSVSYESPISAPIAKGDHIADLIVKRDGKTDRIIPLLAGKNVEKLSFIGQLTAKLKFYILGE